MKYTYDPDSDILTIEVSKKSFDYAEEVGDVIVHFTKNGKPVYLEILHAQQFISNATKSLPKIARQHILHQITTA